MNSLLLLCSFILVGASGGKGSNGMGSSRGAMVRTVMELRKGQEIYMLVGQEGNSACVKVSIQFYFFKAWITTLKLNCRV